VDAEAEAGTLTNTLAKVLEEQAALKADFQKLAVQPEGANGEALTNRMMAQITLWKRLENAEQVANLHVPAAAKHLEQAREQLADAVRALNDGKAAEAVAKQTEAETGLNSTVAVIGEAVEKFTPTWKMRMYKIFRAKQALAEARPASYSLPASDWLLETMTRPEVADHRRIFQIHHPELLDQLELDTHRKYFTFAEITERKDDDGASANLRWLQTEADRLRDLEEERRTPYDKQVALLHRRVSTYARLKSSLQPESTQDFAAELKAYQETLVEALPALRAFEQGSGHDTQTLNLLSRFFQRYQALDRMALPLILPPLQADHSKENWLNIGAGLMESMKAGEVHPAAMFFARMSTAWRGGQATEFNQTLKDYRAWLAERNFGPETRKGAQEAFFNHYGPFYKSMVLYVAALLLACFFWLNWNPAVRQGAFYLLGLAFLVHTSGLVFRMYLEGRPPVTNLYSSAIFVGWGAVGLGWILERIFKDGIGIVTASGVGFITLIIAHHLSLSGDTMEMLRAVLDTNFWLATHVVAITVGYSAMFVAGFLAIIYIVRGFFTTSLAADTAKSLTRMVYGILCFATLFSFVGTILGGIWADQSWGRFWGWDPKENGALMIVLWCAIVLHARWGGLIRERGLMALAVFGNIVTAFSWFGVNMLGIGLHSYGFMDAAFKWLMAFNATQLAIIALCLMPLRNWKSFKHLPPEPPKDGGEVSGAAPVPAKA
jgi:ABC-type transport system involved in cytochrome c biogenesis permease subunit